MLPSSGCFNKFPCPDSKSGECHRPYCHFGGHSSNSVGADSSTTTTTTASEIGASIDSSSSSNGVQLPKLESIDGGVSSIPSYSTASTDEFQGYQGYFATSDSPPPAVPKRGLLPTPPVVNSPSSSSTSRPSRPSQRVPPQIQPRNSPRSPAIKKSTTIVKPSPASPLTKPTTKEQPNLNSFARDLAAINNEIERLQRKLTGGGSSDRGASDDGTMELDGSNGIPAYDPAEPVAKRGRYAGRGSASSTNESSSDEQQYRPGASSKTSSAYKPTPIGDLQKPKNKLLKDGSYIGDKKTDVSTKKSSSSSTTKSGNSGTRSAALLEKGRKRQSSNVSELFGDDSDTESSSTSAGRRGTFSKKLSSTTSKSKDDPEDMASIIEDFIAPTAAAAAAAAAANAQRKKTTMKNDSHDGDNQFKKKRVVDLSNSSVDAVKKLRKVGGERSKGHLLSARKQLEARMAQLNKQQEELKAKQREETKVVRNQKDDYKTSGPNDIATIPKGERRLARVPKPAEQSKPGGRPVIPIEVGGKVPSNIRQQYLNMIIDEFLKFLSEEEAYLQAVEEERAVYAKSASRQGYLNAIANAIKRVREISTSSSTGSSAGKSTAVSHSSVIGGKPASKASFTIGRSGAKASSALSGEEFYEALLSFVLTLELQVANGYPRPDPEHPNTAVYGKESIMKMFVDDDDLKRICIRCGKLFYLTPYNEYVMRDDCIFHWGRAWKRKIAGQFESRYTCCQEDLSAAGCSVSRYHVSDAMPRRSLSGYVYTAEWPGSQRSGGKVFALDCEMVYTTGGNELARVTVVNDQCQVVYERCVRPDNQILDYNTRFSGLTEELLLKNDEAVSLEDVQNDLATMFTTEAILIGHSLESDLRALRMIHDKVIDTSVVFPHRLGAPYKRALKTLAIEFLKKIIQDDSDGHDSKEDAVTCMDLMKWRVKQDKRKE